jgi:large subunit ribosomal protein L18
MGKEMKFDLKAIGKKDKSRALHLRRKARIRKVSFGTKERPRLSVFKSAKHIYVQAIDDNAAVTIASVGTLDAAVASKAKGLKKVDVAKLVGEMIGKKLKDANIETAIFDRNGFRYTGRIAAIAEGARSASLII